MQGSRYGNYTVHDMVQVFWACICACKHAANTTVGRARFLYAFLLTYQDNSQLSFFLTVKPFVHNFVCFRCSSFQFWCHCWHHCGVSGSGSLHPVCLNDPTTVPGDKKEKTYQIDQYRYVSKWTPTAILVCCLATQNS